MAKNNNHPEKNTIDLPEVKDIPGQENVKPPRLGELADTTASSAGEEGDRTFNTADDKDDLGIVMGTEADVSPEERSVLANIDRRKAESEDAPLITGALDDRDDEGTLLNERSDDLSGEELDVPGAEEDDSDEDIGEEDEENNEYSLNDDNGDNND
jgi:hypothetical protein